MSVEVEPQRLQSARSNIIRLDGRKLLEPSQVFTPFNAAMQIPDNFSRTWDALPGCLHDWRTHGFDSEDVAIVIDHADDLSDRLFFGTFVAVLCQMVTRGYSPPGLFSIAT
jgi:hypothetical protein